MTDTLTHALTIHQPYAWAVAAGHKPVENRTWRPPLEAVGKLIGIHAGRAPNSIFGLSSAQVRERIAAPVRTALGAVAIPDDLPRGALIGVARLVGVVRRHPVTARFHWLDGRADLGRPLDSVALTDADLLPWWLGPLGWVLTEAVLLPEPIPMRGQQGLWRIPHLAINRVAPDTLSVSPRWADVWALEQWRKARETR